MWVKKEVYFSKYDTPSPPFLTRVYIRFITVVTYTWQVRKLSSFTRDMQSAAIRVTSFYTNTWSQSIKGELLSLFCLATPLNEPRNNPNIVQRLFTAALLGDVNNHNNQCQTDKNVYLCVCCVCAHLWPQRSDSKNGKMRECWWICLVCMWQYRTDIVKTKTVLHWLSAKTEDFVPHSLSLGAVSELYNSFRNLKSIRV